MIENNKFKKSDTFPDGFIKYGLIKIIRNNLGVKIKEEFIEQGKLAFGDVNIRDNDNVTASSLGYTIDKKIKVPYRKLNNNIKIKINNENDLYDVVKRDSPNKKTLYIYLQIAKNESEVIV